MPNSYYNHSLYPAPNAPGSSAALRAELDLITAGFNKLPTLAGNAGKLVAVKSDESGLEAVTNFTIGTITGNLIGNVTGNVTGDIVSSNTSTFNNVTVTGTLDMSVGTAGTITGLSTPTNDTDAANKAYVDSVAQGLDIKPSVRVATTANITLSGTQTIDGVTLSAGDRVLVKDQSSPAQNGIYSVASGSWSRTNDMNVWAELPGAFVFVEEGTTNDNSGWVCTVPQGGTLGSTPVTFEQFSGAGQINAGAGLTKSGNTIDVGTASSARIVVNANNIDLATTGVVAGTYNNVTVDAYGRITAGTTDSFGYLYLGSKASDPTTDNQGGALLVGSMYFNTTSNKMRVYSSTSAWIDAGSSVNGTSSRATYTATAGQTSFAITYDVGYVDVYLNGLKLQAGVEFIATNGTSIVLATGAAAGDIVDIVAYGAFTLANFYSKAESDSRYLQLSGGTLTGNVTLSTGVASGVAYLNGSKVLTAGSALTFDGATLAAGGSGGIAHSYGGHTARIYAAAGGTYWGSSTAADLIFQHNNLEGMRLTSTGLGIGTSSPATKLDVSANGVSQIAIRNTSGSTKNTQLIYADSVGNKWQVGMDVATNNGSTMFQWYYAPNAVSYLNLDSSGNLGLGVTPSAWFANSRAIDIGTGGAVQGRSNDATTFELATNAYLDSAGTWRYKTTNRAGLFSLSNGSYAWNVAASGTAGNAISFTQPMTLDASGNLGIGTTSPSYKLHVVGGQARIDVSAASTSLVCLGTGSNFQVDHSTSGYATLVNSANSGAAMIFKGSSESMRIDSSGNLLVGTTSGPGRLHVKTAGNTGGDWGAQIVNSSGTFMFALLNNGNFYTGSAAGSPYNATTGAGANCVIDADQGRLLRSTSSLKYKTDVQNASHGLAQVMALRPVTYKGINDGDKIFGGLIAEEVHEAGLTEFVQYAEDGTPDALAYANMVSLAFKAIQEQQAIINQLKARLDAANL